MEVDKQLKIINALIEQCVTNEQQTYRQKMGRNMSPIELYAYTTGVFAGFYLALEWATKDDDEVQEK